MLLVEGGELAFQLFDRGIGLFVCRIGRRDIRFELADTVRFERTPLQRLKLRARLRRGLIEPVGVIAEPQRNFVQHVVVRPRRVIVDEPGDLGVEVSHQRTGAVGRRAVATAPEVGKQRIGVVGLALRVAVGLRLGRFLCSRGSDCLGRFHPLRRFDPSCIIGEALPGGFGQRFDGADGGFLMSRCRIPRLFGRRHAGGQLGPLVGQLGKPGLPPFQRVDRGAFGRIELADDMVAGERIELQPGKRLVGLRLLAPQAGRIVGRRGEHLGEPILVAAHAEDRLLDG